MQFCVPLKGDSRKNLSRFDRKTLRSSLQKADSSIGATCDPRVDGENMASFPDLRPNRRSAKAESTAAPGNRARLLLAVSTALLLTASLAVSELATLRGARAHDASVFLTRELGPPLDRPLVRTPAHATPRLVKPALGGKLEIRDGGLKVTSGKSRVSVRFGSKRGSWQAHRHGVQRQLPFGSETIVFGTNSVEQSLTVAKRQGTRTWRWRLDAGNLLTRLTPDGTVRFANAKSDAGLRIQPVAIFDKDHRVVTPHGLRWSVVGHGNRRWLQLRLNDAALPLPYVIDPIALVAACPGGGCATNTTTNGTSVTVTRPTSVVTGTLMLAQVTLRNNNTITAPAGWTTTGNLRTSGAGLEQQIYYRIATAADTSGTTYQWSWTTSSDGAAAILAYSGTDATSPFDLAPTDNAGSGTTATATGLTTTQANDMIDALYGAQGQSGPRPPCRKTAPNRSRKNTPSLPGVHRPARLSSPVPTALRQAPRPRATKRRRSRRPRPGSRIWSP